MPEDAVTIDITIEYSDFIAGWEIAEILELCDDAVWAELEELGWPPFRPLPFGYYRRSASGQSRPLFCVSKVEGGSFVISGILTAAALRYCYNRFRRGYRKSHIDESVEEFITVLLNRAASIVSRITRWIQEYEDEAKAQNSNIKRLSVHKTPISPRHRRTDPRI
jgi:hypothetical protein